eukprot:gene4988-5107_t
MRPKSGRPTASGVGGSLVVVLGLAGVPTSSLQCLDVGGEGLTVCVDRHSGTVSSLSVAGQVLQVSGRSGLSFAGRDVAPAGPPEVSVTNGSVRVSRTFVTTKSASPGQARHPGCPVPHVTRRAQPCTCKRSSPRKRRAPRRERTPP